MSRALPPVLERLQRAAAAPAQLVQREQATRATFETIGAALGRVGLQALGPWQRLLQPPLAEPDEGSGGLQAVLAQIEQGLGQAAAEPTDPRLAGAVPPGPQRRVPTPSQAQVPAAAPTPTRGGGRTERAASAQAAVATALTGASGPTTNTRRKDDGAPDSWLQRATRAGLLDALFTPIQKAASSAGGIVAAPRLQGPGGPSRDASLSAAPSDKPKTRGAGMTDPVPSVRPLLQAALDRIQGAASGELDRGAGGRRTRRGRLTTSAPAGAAASAGSQRAAAWADDHEAPAADAAPDGAPWARLGQALGAAAGRALLPGRPASGQQANGPNELQAGLGLQGLRGLAARAAVTTTAGWRPTSGEPAPSEMTTLTPAQQAAAPDDEQLAEQLARVLKREAERDGIDVSDVLP